MKKSGLLILPLVALSMFTACDDDVTTIGSSLITDKSEIVIDSTFTITGRSVENKVVQSRTVTQLIGRLEAKEYGTLSSEIVTQFMPASEIDTAGVSVNDIDSIKLVMFFNTGAFTGDSLMPMGLQVYPLTKQLPSPIYSNFDPTEYYNPADMWESKIYTGNALASDSLNELYFRSIIVDLPLEFGRKFYSEYLTNPATFDTPQSFANFFPGLYIKNSFGSGRVTNITETRINLFYRRHDTVEVDDVEKDTIYNLVRTYMAVTPEVVTNNILNLTPAADIMARVNSGESILAAPAGLDVEIEFPIVDVIGSYRRQAGELSVINTLTMSIPAEEITNSYGIAPPEYVLVVLKKDKADFFAKNKITDSKTSFLATYNSSTNSYTLSNMRQYLLDMLEKDQLTAEDYTFTITPVDVTTESTSDSYYQTSQTYITSIAPYVSGPSMVQLKLSEAKIKLTFSKQYANF
ncbi:MAG: DUF4270 domain-containing protein [Muribaculaceae bacterium]|nr:DUF4270 domain-containing protein [Muribaculaceae bacterium]